MKVEDKTTNQNLKKMKLLINLEILKVKIYKNLKGLCQFFFLKFSIAFFKS
jgi:hypothetical protein